MSTAAHLQTVYGFLLKRLEAMGYDTSATKNATLYSEDDFKRIILEYGTRAPTPVQSALITSGYTTLRSLLSGLFINPTTQERMLVYFAAVSTTDHVSVAEIQTFSDLMLSTEAKSGMIITSTTLSPPAKTRFRTLQGSDTVKIHNLLDIDLCYDPTVSVWGSSARVMSATESKEFLASNNLQRSKLPQIKVGEDPIATYLFLEKDQLVEFTRQPFIPEQIVPEQLYIRVGAKRPPEPKSSRR